VILALGRHAAQTLLRTNETIGKLRGRWHSYQGIPLRVTYHPAYLLRTPGDKKKTWEDVKEVLKLLAGEAEPGA
jgi:DNA polymerase